MTASGGILPPIRWSALGLDVARGSLVVAGFDGDVILDDDILPGRDLLDWLEAQRSIGVDLIATPTLPQGIVGTLANDTRAADLIVPLDDWSMLLGIRPAVVDPSLSAIANRLAHVYEQLVHLDPSILQHAIGNSTVRSGGEFRLLSSALARSSVAHPGASTPLELMFLGNRPKPERLKLRKDGEPVDPEQAAALFATDGPIASHYAAWEERPQQTQLARRVAETLSEGGETITEAGTGTGKSLAYLIPALLHAVQTGEQVVVATNTRVLQDQLALKDAPIAVDAVRQACPGEEPTVHVLKGRANYLCLRRWFSETASPLQPTDQAGSTFRSRATIWLTVTESGERSELNLDREGGRAFDRISAEGEACDASTCKFQQKNQCFLYRARRQADAAHVVVTNHALLLTDVVQGGEALPDAKHLIIDEAHHLEDQATSSFQTAVSMRILSAALNLLSSDGRRTSGPGLLTEVDGFFGSRAMSFLPEADRAEIRSAIGSANRQHNDVRLAAESMFQELAALVTRHGEHARDYASRMRLTPVIRGGSDWSDIERKWDTLNLAMVGLIANLSELQRQLPDLSRVEMDAQEAEKAVLRVEDLENRLGVARHTFSDLGAQLNGAIHNPTAAYVYWLESRAGDTQHTTLSSAPLTLAEYLRQHLYGRLESLVLTSATMTTAGSTSFVRQRLGLPDASELQVSSPFDYERNALLILPTDVPEPNQAGFDAASHQAIFDTAVAAGGRTLVLFTSLAAMNAARIALSDRFAAERLSLVTQHEDGSAEQLAERLRTFDRTVVFGAGAFWEGVDVPGPALSALVITKLPFAVPTDPVVAARSETYDNPFMDYSLPQATLKVRQGFGRLIRSRSDRGVCLLLDRRITSKRYGRLILDTLPQTGREYCTIAQVGSVVASFLEEPAT